MWLLNCIILFGNSLRYYLLIIDKKKYRSIEEARLKLNPKASKRAVKWRYKNGWPIKAALELIKYDKKDREKIKFRGKTYESLSALARAYGISVDLFIRRIKMNLN